LRPTAISEGPHLRAGAAGAPIDRHDPKWAKKGLFVMLMLEENLARVSTYLDVDSVLLTVQQGNQQVMAAQLADEADRAKVAL
jgi:GntR family transcriptional regulator / MocR family aminotransferase